MPQEPADFMRDMNKPCMSMSAQRRTVRSKKHRKAIQRQMKHLAKRAHNHAQTHLDELANRRSETTFQEVQPPSVETTFLGNPCPQIMGKATPQPIESPQPPSTSKTN